MLFFVAVNCSATRYVELKFIILLLFFSRTSVVHQRGAPLGQKGEGNGKLVQNLTFPSPFFPNGSPLWTLPSLNPFFHTLCQILTVLRKTLTCLLSDNVGTVTFYYRILQTISAIFVHMTINVGEHAPVLPRLQLCIMGNWGRRGRRPPTFITSPFIFRLDLFR